MPKFPLWFFILIILVYFTAIRVDTMDVDASQYAEISMGMMRSGDYLHLYDRGNDYLDKPPFVFWVSSLSMKIFGANNFGYKFPSILFAIWALFATYRLAKLLYDKRTGIVSAIILATCQGMFLMTNDVRCDTILMSWVVTAIWMIQEWLNNKKLHYFMLGCAAIAFGMMTKGPIALMVPVFCFFIDWALKRQWRNFLKPQYILGILLIAALLIPMSIGLYQQYDMHPEKRISGLRFFYWSQSFGRITGESPWKNGADISFLMLNMLWSFLPWIFVFLIALFINVKKLVQQKFRLQPHQEWLSTGGFIFTYFSLGSSAYQLPHYIFVAFPLVAIVTGSFITKLIEEKSHQRLLKLLEPFQLILISLLILAMVILITYCFPVTWPTLIFCTICIVGLLGFLIYRRQSDTFIKLLSVPALGMLIINFFLTNHVYYTLLKYQAGNTAGRYISDHHIPTKDVIVYKMHDAVVALHFYAHDVIPQTDTIVNFGGRKYILTMTDGMDDLRKNNITVHTIFSGKLFKVSELTPKFLNPKTRDAELKDYYLVKVAQ